MRTYRLLMVDDECAVRGDIRYAVERSALCFDEILEAENGAEAAAVLQRASDSVDIMITDIQMPVMDGMALLGYVRKKYPDMPVIVLTMHGEFEHARQALRAGAAAHVSKPFTDEELIGALRRAQEVLNKGEARRRLALRTKLNDAVFLGTRLDARRNGLFPPYAFMTARFYARERHSALTAEDVKLAEWLGGDAIVANSRAVSGDTLCLLYGLGAQEAATRLDKAAQGLSQRGIVMTAGVHDAMEDVSRLSIAYAASRSALTQRFNRGAGSIVFTHELSPTRTGPKSGLARPLETAAARGADRDSLIAVIRRIMDEVCAGQVELTQLKRTAAEIIQIMVRTQGILCPREEYISGDFVDQLEDRAALDAFLEGFVLTPSSQDEADAAEEWVERVKQYVDANHFEPIGLGKVAKLFHVSTKHLSRTFKEYTGKEFMNYVTQKRLAQARILLRTTDMSVSDVARSVGYGDAQYFRRVFKQATGKTPAHYREEARQ